jgi:PPOX class probable F420-dependent enzyme
MDTADIRQRFASAPVARLATVREDGAPHVVPVCFALDGNSIVSAVDGKPKRTQRLRRLDNVRAHPEVSFLVDRYDDDWTRLWWVRVDGIATVLEGGVAHVHAIDLLAAKYAQYRQLRPTGPVLVITALRWQGWSAS